MIVQFGALAALLSFVMLAWPRIRWWLSVWLVVRHIVRGWEIDAGIRGFPNPLWWKVTRCLIKYDHLQSHNHVLCRMKIVMLPQGIGLLLPRSGVDPEFAPPGHDTSACLTIGQSAQRLARHRLASRARRMKRLMDAVTAR